MITDNQELLSDAQAITADAASTNIRDFGGDFDIGRGEPMAVVVQIDVAADITTGDETYTFVLQTDDNSGFASPTDIMSRTIAASGLTAGSRFLLPLTLGNERYLRVFYDVGGTTPTMTVTAFLQPMSMIDSQEAYPDALTIS